MKFNAIALVIAFAATALADGCFLDGMSHPQGYTICDAGKVKTCNGQDFVVGDSKASMCILPVTNIGVYRRRARLASRTTL
ncbi:uncharacterized protein F4822DRAFT_338737 [Hypoxylon trugodes]|uniref:uncharacterized protein n=1 Tax=Hypoxylon trugodes TaxID=326681 RepID=UPI0021A1E5A8|nr:uncharacterized protein F4822DRAFT_338737 [Hypoxylon trugodes]KAI1385248.1 hypothetical protein F4822DRAFT_338737 [Hypoxylon trugodes]